MTFNHHSEGSSLILVDTETVFKKVSQNIGRNFPKYSENVFDIPNCMTDTVAIFEFFVKITVRCSTYNGTRR